MKEIALIVNSSYEEILNFLQNLFPWSFSFPESDEEVLL